jgi:hypothetical protein
MVRYLEERFFDPEQLAELERDADALARRLDAVT